MECNLKEPGAHYEGLHRAHAVLDKESVTLKTLDKPLFLSHIQVSRYTRTDVSDE